MISVIMLTYNREQFISKMIEDVLHQTYKDFEFIIVDNGSTDKSGQIAEKYARLDDRIRVIHLDKSYSIGYGRNYGLKDVKGSYVCYVDDDDRIEKDYLEFLMELVKENGADIAMCGADEFIEGEIKPQCMFNEKYVLSAKEAVVELIKREHIRAGMPTKIIKKEIIKAVPFQENCKSEDIHTIYKLLSSAQKIVLHGVPKYHVIRHGNNNSMFTSNYNMFKSDILEEYMEVYQERCDYLTQKFPDGEELWKYSVWSFYISMCDKIEKYHLKDCDNQYKKMQKQLLKDQDMIMQCKYLKENEAKLLTAIEHI